MRTSPVCLALLLCLPVASAQQPGDCKDCQDVPVFYAEDCLRRVAALLERAEAVHDGSYKPRLRTVGARLRKQLARHALWRGALAIRSYVSPPSRYWVYQFADGSLLKSPDSCPLDQTYLLFTPGGFGGEGSAVFGPLE
jgi:hypothetical protein